MFPDFGFLGISDQIRFSTRTESFLFKHRVSFLTRGIYVFGIRDILVEDGNGRVGICLLR